MIIEKYGKLPDKLAEEITWDKLCINPIVLYVISRKFNKLNLHLKDVNIVNLVTAWFEIPHYDDKRGICIAGLVETT